MKKLLFIFACILLASFHANATSTITPNVPADGSPLTSSVVRNNFNAAITDINALQAKFPVSVANGGTAATTTQAALDNIMTPRNFYGGSSLGPTSFQMVPCAGFGDEQSYGNASGTAGTLNRGAVLTRDGCIFDNAWGLSKPSTELFGFGATPMSAFSASISNIQSTYVYMPGILANAAGQTAIDRHGATLTLQNFNMFAQNNNTVDANSLTSFIGTSVQNSPYGPDGGRLNIISSSLGWGSTTIGIPIDANANPVKNHGIKAGSLTAGGSGYVDGTYHNLPFTGGTGSGAYAVTVIVSGGIVTSVKLYDSSFANGAGSGMALPGQNYTVSDVLSLSNANLGGSGSGLQFTVNSLYAPFANANWFPQFLNSFFSYQTGCVACDNFSDARVFGNTFTGGQAFQQFFGGGGNTWGFNRFEDDSNAVDLGGPNGNGFTGTNTLVGNEFTTNSYGGGFDLRIGRGGGDVVVANEIDSNFNYPAYGTTATASFVIGGNADYAGGAWNSNNWHSQPATVGKLYAIDIPSGFTTNYLSMQGNVAQGSTLIANVHYGQTPAQFVEDFVGPFGIHREQGRQWVMGLGSSAPRADFDIAGMASAYLPSLIAPIGSTQLNIVAQSNASAPTGTQAYYKLDDASGSTAVDAISAANGTWHGTLGSQWGTGIINGDGVFNGTDNYIDTTYNGVTGTAARTINMWFKTTTSAPVGSQNTTPLLYYGSASNNQSIQLATNDKYGGGTNFQGLTLDIGGSAITYSTGTKNIYDGGWHMATYAFPASPTLATVKIYLDAQQLTTVSHSLNSGNAINTGTTTKFQIGGSTVPNTYFSGQIDEPSSFPSQLSAGQVLFLYNGGAGNQYPYSAETQSANIFNITDQGSNTVMTVSGAGYLGIGTNAPTGQFTLGNASTHAGQATCWTTNGQIGYCTTVVGAGGACTCTGL